MKSRRPFILSFFLSLFLFGGTSLTHSQDLESVQWQEGEMELNEEQIYQKFYRPSFELRKKSQWEEALGNYRKGILLLGPRDEFIYQLGQTYLEMGKEKKALGIFKWAQEVGINDPEIKGIVTSRVSSLSTHPSVLAALEEEMTEKEVYDKYYWPAFTLRNEKKYDEAIGNYKKLIQLNYGDTNIYKQLAITHAAKGDTLSAIATLDDALKKWPQEKYNRYLYLFQAEYYRQAGNQAKQMETYRQANEFSLQVFKRPHVTAIKHLLTLQDKGFECPLPQEVSSDPVKMLDVLLEDLKAAPEDKGRSQIIAERLTGNFKGKNFKTDEVMTRTPVLVTDELYDMLKDTHEVFTEAGLKYMMAAGTLLGAARHKGIIPWDDDGDLAAAEADLTPQMVKKLNALFAARNMELLEDESCGFKIRRIGEYAPAIDLFLLKKDEKKEFFIYSKEKALQLFPREKVPVAAFEKPPVQVPFGDFQMNALSPEENQAYLDRAYGADWNYLAYQEWDHIHDRPVEKVKVLLVDRKAPLTRGQRGQVSPLLNKVTYIDSFQKENESVFQKEDRDDLRVLLRSCFPGTVQNNNDWIFNNLLLNHKVSLMRGDSGKIEGVIIGYYEEGDSGSSHVYIDKVCMDANQRGKGLGGLLITDFMEKSDSKKTKVFKLMVMRNNHRAKSLYERHPFNFKVTREYESGFEMTRKID